MGKVVYQDPIDHISGKISKKNCQTVYAYRRGSKKKYTQIRTDREGNPSAEEMRIHERFRICRQAAQHRSMDLSHLTYDQMDFMWERSNVRNFKYTTYRGWLFGKAWKYYNESTHEVQFPERFRQQ